MFRQSVLVEFLTFALFYVILKVILQFINVEARRNSWHLPAAVSGILA
jgi:hypothetical protein